MARNWKTNILKTTKIYVIMVKLIYEIFDDDLHHAAHNTQFIVIVLNVTCKSTA